MRRGDTGVYQLIIRNGMVVDGTGSPSYHADVAAKTTASLVRTKPVSIGSSEPVFFVSITRRRAVDNRKKAGIMKPK